MLYGEREKKRENENLSPTECNRKNEKKIMLLVFIDCSLYVDTHFSSLSSKLKFLI
jgi:hypothetical protein